MAADDLGAALSSARQCLFGSRRVLDWCEFNRWGWAIMKIDSYSLFPSSSRASARVGSLASGPRAIGIGFAVLCSFCFVGSVRAEADWTRSGIYLAVAGVGATDLYEDELEDAIEDQVGPGVGIDIESTGGVSARVGVRFLTALAFEVHYEWISEYDVELNLGGPANIGKVGVEHHTLTGNVRLNIPIGRVQPYVLAGLGFQRIETDATIAGLGIRDRDQSTSVAGRVGAGIEIYLTEHVALFGEGLVVLTNHEIDLGNQDFDHIFYGGGAGGLTFRF